MAKNETAAAESGQKPGQWGVKDLNATREPRIHEPVAGHKYKLTATEFTYMDAAHAAKFLCDKAFYVVNEDGQRVQNIPEANLTRAGTTPIRLEPGQTIASLDELSNDALLARAANKPGGERFKKNAKRQDLVDFLLGHALKQDEEKSGGEGGDTLTEDMNPEDTARLLGGA